MRTDLPLKVYYIYNSVGIIIVMVMTVQQFEYNKVNYFIHFTVKLAKPCISLEGTYLSKFIKYYCVLSYP